MTWRAERMGSSTGQGGNAEAYIDEDVVLLPNGQPLTADAFYQERDNRTQLLGTYRRREVRVAIALGYDASGSVAGQTGLLWASSMVRRMGRPFAPVRILSPAGARGEPLVAVSGRYRECDTLGDAVDMELIGADPFAPYDWADLDAPDAFSGMEAVIWIGASPALGAAVPRCMSVGGRGWVVAIQDNVAGARATLETTPDPVRDEESFPNASLDMATAAIVAGVAFAAAAIHQQVQVDSSGTAAQPEARYWYATDTGAVTENAHEGSEWMLRGSSAPTCAAWSAASGGTPHGNQLVLVSAGGIGGNVAQLLGDSHAVIDEAHVLDADSIDISNLNRLIGVYVSDVGTPKVAAAVTALSGIAATITGEAMRYEAWAPLHRSILDATRAVTVIGVDQIATRLEAQADWPAVVINGSTAGTTWNISTHLRGVGACLGCLYATDRSSYARTRGPQACGAAGAPLALPQPQPNEVGTPRQGAREPVAAINQGPARDASIPFVSVSAAAVIVTRLIREWAVETGAGPTVAESPNNVTADGETALVTRMNVYKPLSTLTSHLTQHAECLLLCGSRAVATLFGRKDAYVDVSPGNQSAASEGQLEAPLADAATFTESGEGVT